MLFLSDTIFDEYLPVTALSASSAVTTSSKLNSTLGQYDQCSFQIVADSLVVTPLTVTVMLQHSADGRNWLDRSSVVLSIPLAVSPATGGSDQKTLADAGNTPLLGYVRLAFWLGTAATAHVRVTATLRDGR
jgi:hypothetical protein